MKQKTTYILILTFILFFCIDALSTPIPVGYIDLAMYKADDKKDKKKKKSKKEIKDSIAAVQIRLDSLERIANYYAQFNDTTNIRLENIVMVGQESYMDEYNAIIAEFDKGNFKEALASFEVYAGILPADDSLFYETQFFISECYISLNFLNRAKGLLEQLEGSTSIPDEVMQKVLVRLGQVWCVLDDKINAETYFNLLRQKYPNSKYLPLADCSVVY